MTWMVVRGLNNIKEVYIQVIYIIFSWQIIVTVLLFYFSEFTVSLQSLQIRSTFIKVNKILTFAWKYECAVQLSISHTENINPIISDKKQNSSCC